MSFSMLEPEEAPVCECRYDETRDRMDRDDCPFHCGFTNDLDSTEMLELEQKRPTRDLGKRREGAA